MPEKRQLSIASHYCCLSEGDVIATGRTLLLSEILGYKLRRTEGKEFNFVVNDKGLEAVLDSTPNATQEDLFSGVGADAYSKKNGIYVSFFHKRLGGYEIREEIFYQAVRKETSVGAVFIMPIEMDLVFKFRRGIWEKGLVYPRDGLDTAVTIIGLELSGNGFNHETFSDNLLGEIYAGSTSKEALGCIEQLQSFSSQVALKNRDLYMDKLRKCTDYIEKTYAQQKVSASL